MLSLAIDFDCRMTAIGEGTSPGFGSSLDTKWDLYRFRKLLPATTHCSSSQARSTTPYLLMITFKDKYYAVLHNRE